MDFTNHDYVNIPSTSTNKQSASGKPGWNTFLKWISKWNRRRERSTNKQSIPTHKPSNSTNNIMVLDGSFRSQIKLWGTIFEKIYYQYVINNENSEVAHIIHTEFLNAGANVIRTNTCRASEDFLRSDMKYCDEDINKFFSQSVNNAKTAVQNYRVGKENESKDYMVVGSCGSVTDCYSYKFERKNREEFMKYHKLRAKLLIDNKVDVLAFESIPVAEEAYAIVELMREFPNSKAWISFRSTMKKLMDGSDLIEIARDCYNRLQPQICAVGINCVHPLAVRQILDAINDENNRQSMIPLVVYPNSGNYHKYNKQWRPMNNNTEYPVREWLNMNIRYIGGCCNVMPENIQSIRAEVDKLNQISQFQT